MSGSFCDVSALTLLIRTQMVEVFWRAWSRPTHFVLYEKRGGGYFRKPLCNSEIEIYNEFSFTTMAINIMYHLKHEHKARIASVFE